MTASLSKPDRIQAEMGDLERRMARIQADATREMLRLEARLRDLRGELSEAFREEDVAPVPVLKAAAGTHTLNGVRPQKPWVNLFKEAVGNLKAWCKDKNVSYSAAKSWTSKGKSTKRPIPRKWANYCLTHYQIPLDFWPHGITDGYPARDGE
jgi:hypothetical protein